MKTYDNEELAEMAGWADELAMSDQNVNKKRAYGAIRQGIDWLLRERILEHKKKIATIDQPKVVERHQ